MEFFRVPMEKIKSLWNSFAVGIIVFIVGRKSLLANKEKIEWNDPDRFLAVYKYIKQKGHIK